MDKWSVPVLLSFIPVFIIPVACWCWQLIINDKNMTNRNIFKTLLSIVLMVSCFTAHAQYKVKQVLVANGGAFAFTGNYITIGSYDPTSKKYTLFDSITGGSVTQILIDSGFAYMATDSYLVKYNLSSLKRVDTIKCRDLRYLTVYKDKIVATVGYDLTTTHLKIFKKSNLSLVYSENKMPNIYANGITIVGDSAYIALQGQYPDYSDTGRIAVEDLANQKFKRVIKLDTAARGIGDMFAIGNTIVGVTEYPYSCISEVNLLTGAKKISVFNSISTPFALYNDTLYADFNNEIDGYNLTANNTKLYIPVSQGYAAAALDTVNKLFYYTGSSFSKPTWTWIYNYNNKAVDSFKVGIAPEGIAIDYYNTLGINEQNFSNNSFMIYPNPANNSLNISGIDAKNAEIKIIDLTGRVLSTNTANLSVAGITNIPVSQLPQGIYFINIQSNEGIVSKEFVKN